MLEMQIIQGVTKKNTHQDKLLDERSKWMRKILMRIVTNIEINFLSQKNSS